MSEPELRRRVTRATEPNDSTDLRRALERFAERAAEERLLDVVYATLPSPLGDLLVAATPRGVVRLAYLEGLDPDSVLHDLATRVSPRVVEAPARLDEERRQLEAYFERRLPGFDLPVDLSLVGPFASKVLKRTADIPFGDVSTYGTVAGEIGHARAARAVGNALGSNPIPIVVPCHRVLHADGGLGGYTGGLHRKRLLLSIERGTS
jgi:methylated-DNA-[protein]-cysteine S-methyltransferase